MVTKAVLTYSDGSEATFTGEPLDLTTIPLQSTAEQDAQAAADAAAVAVEAPVEAVPADATPVDVAPVEAAPVEAAPVVAEVAPQEVHLTEGETLEVVVDAPAA